MNALRFMPKSFGMSSRWKDPLIGWSDLLDQSSQTGYFPDLGVAICVVAQLWQR